MYEDFLCNPVDTYMKPHGSLHYIAQLGHNHMDFDNVDFCKLMLMDSLNQQRIQVFYILQMDLLHMREGNNIELCDTHQFDKGR